jgi:hypothetical protein
MDEQQMKKDANLQVCSGATCCRAHTFVDNRHKTRSVVVFRDRLAAVIGPDRTQG